LAPCYCPSCSGGDGCEHYHLLEEEAQRQLDARKVHTCHSVGVRAAMDYGASHGRVVRSGAHHTAEADLPEYIQQQLIYKLMLPEDHPDITDTKLEAFVSLHGWDAADKEYQRVRAAEDVVSKAPAHPGEEPQHVHLFHVHSVWPCPAAKLMHSAAAGGLKKEKKRKTRTDFWHPDDKAEIASKVSDIRREVGHGDKLHLKPTPEVRGRVAGALGGTNKTNKRQWNTLFQMYVVAPLGAVAGIVTRTFLVSPSVRKPATSRVPARRSQRGKSPKRSKRGKSSSTPSEA
jgi:hypothetical protein